MHNLLVLLQSAKSKNEGRSEHMAEDMSMKNCLSLEALHERYNNTTYFTSDVVFGHGDRYLESTVLEKVISCNEY